MERLRALFAAMSVAGVISSAAAFADVTVTGEPGDLTVEASEAEVADVIVAVAEAVGSTIEPPDDLPDAPVTGVYRGSVAEVLRALVPSADFFVAWRDGSVEVHFLADGERPSVAEAAPAGEEVPPEAEPSDGEPDPADEEPGAPADRQAPPAPARRIY
jgi:hypothetical protein